MTQAGGRAYLKSALARAHILHGSAPGWWCYAESDSRATDGCATFFVAPQGVERVANRSMTWLHCELPETPSDDVMQFLKRVAREFGVPKGSMPAGPDIVLFRDGRDLTVWNDTIVMNAEGRFWLFRFSPPRALPPAL